MRGKVLAAGLTAAATVAMAGAVPASAATKGTWFYASTGQKLVKVELVGTKIVKTKTLKSSASTDARYEPMSVLGSHAAGTFGVYDSTSSTYAYSLFTYDAAKGKYLALTTTKHNQVMWAALYDKGKSVAYIDQVGSRSEIREMPSTGGTAVTKYTAPKSMSLTSLAVTPTGRKFFFGGYTNGKARVYSLKAGSSKPAALTKAVQAFGDTALSLSPTGNTLAYSPEAFPPLKTGIRLLKVARGGIAKSMNYQGDASTISWSSNGATLYNADQNANGWFRENVSTGKSTALDFNTTGHYLYPVRA